MHKQGLGERQWAYAGVSQEGEKLGSSASFFASVCSGVRKVYLVATIARTPSLRVCISRNKSLGAYIEHSCFRVTNFPHANFLPSFTRFSML